MVTTIQQLHCHSIQASHGHTHLILDGGKKHRRCWERLETDKRTPGNKTGDVRSVFLGGWMDFLLLDFLGGEFCLFGFHSYFC